MTVDPALAERTALLVRIAEREAVHLEPADRGVFGAGLPIERIVALPETTDLPRVAVLLDASRHLAGEVRRRLETFAS